MLIQYTLYSSLFSAFTILLLVKWGFIEYLQIYAPKLLAKLASCNFCLSFWVNCIFSLMGLFISKDAYFILVPFLSAPITRYLL